MAKSKKRKRNRDPAYHPQKSMHVAYKSNVPVISLMGAASSPAKKGIAILSTRSPKRISSATHGNYHLSPDEVTLHTPKKRAHTTFVNKKTPNETKLIKHRTIHTKDHRGKNTISIYLSEDKSTNITEKIPKSPKSNLSQLALPSIEKPSSEYMKVTLKKLNKIQEIKTKKINAGQNSRIKSQKEIMHISAQEVARKAGLPTGTPEHIWHWCHLLAHTLVGDPGQTASNLVLGTKEANAEMTLVELIIKKILEKHDPLYLKVTPKFVPGFEAIRLAKNISYIIQDKPGDAYKTQVSLYFNMLSRNKTSISEVEIYDKLLPILFSDINSSRQNTNDLFTSTTAQKHENISLFSSQQHTSTRKKKPRFK